MKYLYKEMVTSTVNFLMDYQVTLGLLVVLSFLLLWKLWNFMKLYDQFPSYPIIPYLTIATVLRKVPKHLPFTSFIFQKLVSLSKNFHDQGMFLMWLPRPMLVIYGEDAVKIFSNEQGSQNKSWHYEILREVLGTGLITNNGESWKKDRKMLNPVFHVGILKSKVRIFNEHAQILVKKLRESTNETSIDVLKYLQPCTFGVICEYILGLKMDTLKHAKDMDTFIKCITEFTELAVQRFFQPWLRFKFMLKFAPSSRKLLKTLDVVHGITWKIILEMRKSIIASRANLDNQGESKSEREEKPTRKSFAHILMEHHLKDPSFTMEDLESQVITFISAGYDTVSYTLMWSLYMLGLHPDVQDHAYNEVESISAEECITYEDLLKLNYLECVIKETLRLYPAIPLYARSVSGNIQCGKYQVPKGTDVAFFPYMIHRNPEMYPDPEKFNPERFQESNYETQNRIYVPFSEGIRNCIGKRFAMMEMKVILAYILRNFKITSLDLREDVDLSWEIVLLPVRPLLFRLTSRK